MQLHLFAHLGRLLQSESDLSNADFEVLVHLSESPGDCVRVYELAEQLEWERSRLSHHLTRMERRGLVRRACLCLRRARVVRRGHWRRAPGHRGGSPGPCRCGAAPLRRGTGPRSTAHHGRSLETGAGRPPSGFLMPPRRAGPPASATQPAGLFSPLGCSRLDTQSLAVTRPPCGWPGLTSHARASARSAKARAASARCGPFS